MHIYRGFLSLQERGEKYGERGRGILEFSHCISCNLVLHVSTNSGRLSIMELKWKRRWTGSICRAWFGFDHFVSDYESMSGRVTLSDPGCREHSSITCRGIKVGQQEDPTMTGGRGERERKRAEYNQNQTWFPVLMYRLNGYFVIILGSVIRPRAGSS